MHSLLSAFFSEALAEFRILPMEESLLQFSFELVIEDDLRTLDSLQLSAALSLESTDIRPVFVCADESLLSTAADRDMDTENPAA